MTAGIEAVEGGAPERNIRSRGAVTFRHLADGLAPGSQQTPSGPTLHATRPSPAPAPGILPAALLPDIGSGVGGVGPGPCPGAHRPVGWPKGKPQCGPCGRERGGREPKGAWYQTACVSPLWLWVNLPSSLPSYQLCWCHRLQAAWVPASIAVFTWRVTVRLFPLKGPPSGQELP